MMDKVNDLVHRTSHIVLDPSTTTGDEPAIAKSAEGDTISDWNPSMVSYLEQIYKSLTAKADFFEKVQHETVEQPPISDNQVADPLTSLADFQAYMASPSSSAMQSPKQLDLSAPITDYFVSTSHNTYLTGNQLYSDAAASSYTHVLLSGCRSVEIDVWDGETEYDSSSDDDSSSSSSDSDEEKKKEKKAKKETKSQSRLERVSTKIEKIEKTSSKLEGKLEGKIGGLLGRKSSPPDGQQPVSSEPAAAAGDGTEVPTHREPMVLHGHTLTKATTFREVCFAIRESAFTVSDLPVIVSLEVHACLEQQQMMVDIMQEAWEGLLVDFPPDNEGVKTMPPLESLKRKILIKAKWVPDNNVEKLGEDIENYVDHIEESKQQKAQDESSSQPSAPPPPKKPSKMLHALSRLAVYTKGFHFSHFTQPEAKLPEHVFSLSENAAKTAQTNDHEALFKHNQQFFMRIYPAGLRVNSSNLDPTFFWRTGAQLVALNWQSLDKGMMLNHGMFAGEKGWVLKPQGYRSTATKPDAAVDRKLDLSIEVFAGQGLSLPPGQTKERSFHPYVTVLLHVEQPDEDAGVANEDNSTDAEKSSYKRSIKSATGVNPDFKSQTIRFPTVSRIDEELSFVRFKIKDDEIGRDSLAAWACIKLDRLQQGYRLLHLYDASGLQSGGVLLVKVVKSIH